MNGFPSGFVGHGSPMNALGGDTAAAWAAWGDALDTPAGILMVSAHFEARPPTLSSTSGAPLVYDFWGFPDEMYRQSYEPPVAPGVAALVEKAFGSATVRRDEDRGLDHGAWVPLMHMFPDADVPVVQLSIPWTEDPEEMLAMGRSLAPLRTEGVFVVGSGNIVHNLRRVDWEDGGSVVSWAQEFDGWVAETAADGRAGQLSRYREHPLARVSHPTQEHFVPLLVAAGAADGAEVSFPVTGFELGSISARAVQFGSVE